MLVKPEELRTELYPEIIDQITRRDPGELTLQLKAAEDFVKSFLFKYDLKALFGTDDEEPTHPDENLKKIVKIIASYYLARKCGASVGLDPFREDMEWMVGTRREPGWLHDIKEGKTNPDWPYKNDNPDTSTDESKAQQDVAWSSNIKRKNNFD